MEVSFYRTGTNYKGICWIQTFFWYSAVFNKFYIQDTTIKNLIKLALFVKLSKPT